MIEVFVLTMKFAILPCPRLAHFRCPGRLQESHPRARFRRRVEGAVGRRARVVWEEFQ